MNYPALVRQPRGGTEEPRKTPVYGESRTHHLPHQSCDWRGLSKLVRPHVIRIFAREFYQLRDKDLWSRNDKKLSFEENNYNHMHIWLIVHTVLQGSVLNISPYLLRIRCHNTLYKWKVLEFFIHIVTSVFRKLVVFPSSDVQNGLGKLFFWVSS